MRKLQTLVLACLVLTSAGGCFHSVEYIGSLENTEFLLQWNSKRDRRGFIDGPNYAYWTEIKEVQPGMSQASVQVMFGKPQASIERDGVTEWNWQSGFIGNLSSLTIRFINNKVSEAPEFEVVTVPVFMTGGTEGLKPGISDTQVLQVMGEKPTSIVMVGNRATYVWEHTSRIRRSGSKESMFYNGTPYWITGDGLYHFSVKVHIENGKQVGDAIVEESKVR